MIYITGDTHSDFTRVIEFCHHRRTTPDDILIILGDAGINYYANERDRHLKKQLSALPITLFCLHGNHERRPQTLPEYREAEWHGGKVFIEDEFPNLIFARDGEVFTLGGASCIVIGGAYSVDKYFRLHYGWHWFDDEQPDAAIKARVEAQLARLNHQVEVVLSHTCPLKYVPVEVFIPGIDQSRVDKSTEQWLDTIEDRLTYRKWYCAHFHTEKKIDKLQILFRNIEEFTGAIPDFL